MDRFHKALVDEGIIVGENLWGTDTYTADSTLALAAVHAGVLKPGYKVTEPTKLPLACVAVA